MCATTYVPPPSGTIFRLAKPLFPISPERVIFQSPLSRTLPKKLLVGSIVRETDIKKHNDSLVGCRAPASATFPIAIHQNPRPSENHPSFLSTLGHRLRGRSARHATQRTVVGRRSCELGASVVCERDNAKRLGFDETRNDRQ